MDLRVVNYDTHCYYNSIFRIDRIKDPFVQEVLEYWKKNNWVGTLYCVIDQDLVDEEMSNQIQLADQNVSDLNGQVVSFVLVQTDQPDFWTIRGTWTDPNYRGRGLSSQLLKLVISDSYISTDYLWVNITPGAEPLYEKVGFHIYGKRTDCEPQFPIGVQSIKSLIEEKTQFINKYKKHVLF